MYFKNTHSTCIFYNITIIFIDVAHFKKLGDVAKIIVLIIFTWAITCQFSYTNLVKTNNTIKICCKEKLPTHTLLLNLYFNIDNAIEVIYI